MPRAPRARTSRRRRCYRCAAPPHRHALIPAWCRSARPPPRALTVHVHTHTRPLLAPQISKLLLDRGANLKARDNKGNIALHYAAWGGHAAIVAAQLAVSAETARQIVNAQALTGETALHQAARNGHVAAVKVLLQYGGDTDVRDKESMNSLDLAARYDRRDVADELVSYNAELIGMAGGHDTVHTPLHLAARNGHEVLVKRLLDKGHPLNVVTKSGSALHEATFAGKAAVVRFLLKCSIDRSIRNAQNQTAVEMLDAVRGSKDIRQMLWQAENEVEALEGSNKTIADSTGNVQATVVRDYTPGVFDAGALRLTVGDVITVTDLSDQVTWSGTCLDRNLRGTFPADCVELGAAAGTATRAEDLGPSVRLGVGVSQVHVKTMQEVKKEYNPFLMANPQGPDGGGDSSDGDDADVDDLFAQMFASAGASPASPEPAPGQGQGQGQGQGRAAENPLLRTTGVAFGVVYLGSLSARDATDTGRMPRFFQKLRATDEAGHAAVQLVVSGTCPRPCVCACACTESVCVWGGGVVCGCYTHIRTRVRLEGWAAFGAHQRQTCGFAAPDLPPPHAAVRPGAPPHPCAVHARSTASQVRFVDPNTGAAGIEHAAGDVTHIECDDASRAVAGYLVRSPGQSKGFCHVVQASRGQHPTPPHPTPPHPHPCTLIRSNSDRGEKGKGCVEGRVACTYCGIHMGCVWGAKLTKAREHQITRHPGMYLRTVAGRVGG